MPSDSDVILFHIYASWFLPPCRWQFVVVFGRRPSRSPTMNLRRTRASRRRLTWRWCGLKQLSCCGCWVFAGSGHFVNWHVQRSRTDRVLVTVTPRIFMTSTRLMLARNSWKRGCRRLSVNTISWDLARLRVKLLACAHLSTLTSSSDLLCTLSDGMMM